jgi:hypothetical protein
MERDVSEYQGTGPQRLVEFPGWNQVVLGVTDVELDQLGLDVIEIRASVVREEGRLVMGAKLDIFS